MRRITGLKLVSQQEKNRLHSVSQSAEITPLVRKDIQSHLVQLERHIEKLDTKRKPSFRLIGSWPGNSAIWCRCGVSPESVRYTSWLSWSFWPLT